MNKQHFEAFAEEVREWRRIGRNDELAGLKKDAANAFSMAMGIQCATIKIGKRFNPNFDEAKFLAACNPEGGHYPKHPKA